MTEKRFQALARLVKAGMATRDEMQQLLDHADDLRSFAVDQINDADKWDQEWPILGYAPGADGGYDELRKRLL